MTVQKCFNKPHSHLRIFVRKGLRQKMFIHYLVLRKRNMWLPAYVFRKTLHIP